MTKATILALALAGLFSAVLVAQDHKAINKTCPIMRGKAVNPAITVSYEGQTIGLCCKKCLKAWNENPKAYIGNVEEFKAKEEKKEVAATDEKAEVGKKAPDFTLEDTTGAKVTLSDFKGKIVVLQWINPRCPVCVRVTKSGLVNKMVADMKAASKDLVYLPICSKDGAESKDIAAYLEEHKVDAKGVMDPTSKVGRAYQAKTTPHLFVIDAEGILRYAGAIDDDKDGSKGDKAKNYALNAVKQLVAGQKVDPATTTSYGCGIKYAKSAN